MKSWGFSHTDEQCFCSSPHQVVTFVLSGRSYKRSQGFCKIYCHNYLELRLRHISSKARWGSNYFLTTPDISKLILFFSPEMSFSLHSEINFQADCLISYLSIYPTHYCGSYDCPSYFFLLLFFFAHSFTHHLKNQNKNVSINHEREKTPFEIWAVCRYLVILTFKMLIILKCHTLSATDGGIGHPPFRQIKNMRRKRGSCRAQPLLIRVFYHNIYIGLLYSKRKIEGKIHF